MNSLEKDDANNYETVEEKLNKEDFILIRLDEFLDSNQTDFRALSKLREIVYYLKTFTDVKQCENYIRTQLNENIFLIASATIGQLFVRTIHEHTQIKCIYILCQHNRQQLTKWTADYSKTMNHIYTHFKTADFKLSHLLAQTLVRLPREEKAKNEMIKNLKEYYHDSQFNIEFIDDYIVNYQPKDAIKWYTKAGCLFRILNRTFREGNIDNMYKYRSFIKDLSEQIDILCQEHSELGITDYIAYRGTCLSYQYIDILKVNKGKLISFNGFLSTSLDKQIALLFMQQNDEDNEMESILFEYYVDSKISASFAYVGLLSVHPDEKELLINIGTIFRIDDIQYDEKEKLWHVKLMICEKTYHIGQHYLDEDDGQQPSNLLNFGRLLIEAGQTEKAEKFYLNLLNDYINNNDSKATCECYNGLGLVYFDMSIYQSSLDMYFKALNFSSDKQFLANTYCGIANVYDNMGEYDLSLDYYNKSLLLDDDESSNKATTMNNIANVYHHKGDYKTSINYYHKALNLFKQTLDNDKHPKLAGTYNNLGLVYTRNGEYENAIDNYQKSLSIIKQTLPSNHALFAKCYNNIGLVHFYNGDSNSAYEYFSMALDVTSKTTILHSDISATYGNMGIIHCIQNNYDLAISYHIKAIDICNQILSNNHPDLGARYVDLGFTHAKKGNFDDAMMYYEKVLSIFNQSLNITIQHNDYHPRIAHVYSNIVLLYTNKCDFDKALQYLTKSFDIKVNVLHSNHPDLIKNYTNLGTVYHHLLQETYEENHISLTTIYDNIGTIYYEKSDFDLALIYYKKSMNIRQYVLKETHSDIGNSLNLIGRIHSNQKQYDKSLMCYKQALEIYNKGDSKNTIDIAIIYHNMGDVYFQQTEYETGLKYYNKSLETFKTILNENHSHIATAYTSIANVYYQTDKYDLSAQYYMKSLKILQQIYPKNHPEVAVTLNNIANVFCSTEQYDFAIDCYEKSLEIYKMNFPINHPKIKVSQNNLALCYKNLASNYVNDNEDYKMALDLCQKVLEIYEQTLPETHINVVTIKRDIETLLQKLSVVPYVFDRSLLCEHFSLHSISLHLKRDSDFIALLYYLPLLTDCHVTCDERGTINQDEIYYLEPLPYLVKFQYFGTMLTTDLRLLLELVLSNGKRKLNYLSLYCREEQWPIYTILNKQFLQTYLDNGQFEFYFKIISQTPLIRPQLGISMSNVGYCITQEMFGQIYSLPFAFEKFDIFSNEYFDLVEHPIDNNHNFSSVKSIYLYGSGSIFDSHFLFKLSEMFISLTTLEYTNPYHSLKRHPFQLHKYDFKIDQLKSLIIHHSQYYSITEPLLLLTPNVIELSIEYGYLMQLASLITSPQQFNQIRSLTVLCFNEFYEQFFFHLFPNVEHLHLSFELIKSTIYRTHFSFINNLFECMRQSLSTLKMSNIKCPFDGGKYALIAMKENFRQSIYKYYKNACINWLKQEVRNKQRYTVLFSI
ncbi:unnamed protein product [Didymodactylos carnosus]|uniref:ADP ribosyltransferase domain-containing protein n=1 Tax=Didymodactylos carnosus TaxID=1234261 RepID=A0A814BHZ5_9BILA|nr:unnamed protein product [Didymodactylos carnosus]CAF3706918.1 unnamed protein product [Didymodactylos carnosus]